MHITGDRKGRVYERISDFSNITAKSAHGFRVRFYYVGVFAAYTRAAVMMAIL